MFADVRNMLTSAAPEPTAPPDVIAIRARARVLGRTRRVNLLMAVTLMAVGTLGVARAIPALNPAKVSPNQPAGFGPPSGSTPEDGPTGRYWMEFVTADGTGGGLLKTDLTTGSVCFWYNHFDRAGIFERASDGGRPTVVIIPSETEFEPGPDELDPDSDGTTEGRCSLVERDRL